MAGPGGIVATVGVEVPAVRNVRGVETGSGADPGDGRRERLAAWGRACASRGAAGDACRGPEAFYLVTAVQVAMERGVASPHLGRAARSWGKHAASPAAAIAALSCLREVLVSGVPAGDRDRLHQVLDLAMFHAVDAAASRLHDAARTDPLTGCANRRAFDEDLAHAVRSARTTAMDLAVVAVDLDGLKQVNDTAGHAAGDAALLALVGTLRHTLRESDSLYRTGGDEFAVLAPFTDASGAAELMGRAERRGGPSFSWGVAAVHHGRTTRGDEAAALATAADADLYRRRRHRRGLVSGAGGRRRRG